MTTRVRAQWERLVNFEDDLDQRERALLDIICVDWLLVSLMAAPTAFPIPPVVSKFATPLAIGMVSMTVMLPFVAEVLDEVFDS